MADLYRPTFVHTVSERIKEVFRKLLLFVGTLHKFETGS